MRWHLCLLACASLLTFPVASAGPNHAFVQAAVGKVWVGEYCMDPPEDPLPRDCCPIPFGDLVEPNPCGWGVLRVIYA